MRRILALAPVLCLALAPPSADAQVWDSAATVEYAVARITADSMSDPRHAWSLNWGPFGVRLNRLVSWHLGEPDAELMPGPPEGVYRRPGWLTVNGRTGAVSVCGDADRVGGMALSMAALWLGEGDLIEALTALGVRSTLLRSQPAAALEDVHDHYNRLLGARPAFREWRLERDGREPVSLSETYACTPPGTRHATHCWVVWRITYRPDAPLPGGTCLMPGRQGRG